MRASIAALALVAWVTGPGLAQTAPKELQRLQDVGAELRKCWRPPVGPTGSQLTVTMSFKRDGTLVGAPRITYSKLVGDTEAQKYFVGSVLKAIALCTPLHLSDKLGGAIAGRPFSMRFINIAPEREI